MRRTLWSALPGLIAAAVPALADEVAMAAKGREISYQHCARCHVIDARSGIGGIGSTPSFPLLMSLADGEHRFVTFFDRRPHPAFIRMEGVEPRTPLPANAAEIALTADDLESLLAFVLTLKSTAD